MSPVDIPVSATVAGAAKVGDSEAPSVDAKAAVPEAAPTQPFVPVAEERDALSIVPGAGGCGGYGGCGGISLGGGYPTWGGSPFPTWHQTGYNSFSTGWSDWQPIGGGRRWLQEEPASDIDGSGNGHVVERDACTKRICRHGRCYYTTC